jgi:hypothetical protein
MTGRWPRGDVQTRLLGVVLLATALPGCPLSDRYYLDPRAGSSGGAIDGAGGRSTGGMAGMPGPPMPMGGMSGAVAGAGGIAGGAGKSDRSGKGDKGGMAGRAEVAGTGPAEGGATGACVPTTELCNGVDDDCNDEIDEGSVCPSGCSAQTYADHVYLLCLFPDGPKPTNPEASAACEALGSELGLGVGFELAFIESEAENAMLKNWIKGSAPTSGTGGPGTGFGSQNPVWMGANDIAEEGVWVWGQDAGAVQFFQANAMQSGGMDVNGGYDDFGTGRPNINTSANEDCGAFDAAASWDWNDVNCSDAALGYVCEQNP